MAVFHPRCRALLSVVFDGRGGPNSAPLTVEARPQSATVNRNGYHEADTWSLEFDARALPFDPELIASVAARVYMFDAEGDDQREWALERYEMVRGLADEAELAVEDGQRFILSGRDYTGVLDPEWDPRKKVPAGRPLDKTIEEIADLAAPPGTLARFEVVFDSDRPIPTCGGLQRSTKKKGLWVKPGKTYWDLIYDLAVAHGFIAFVRDSQIIITDPRTQNRATLAEAPRVVYGRHLLSLRAQRRLAKERVPQIEIRAWDPKGRKPITVTYPTKRNTITTGLGTKKDEVLRLPAPDGVVDRDALLRYAQLRYELMARAETTYTFGTRHLAVGRNDNLPDADRRDFDMLRLDAGSAVVIAFDSFNGEQMRVLDTGQREEHLRSQGYSGAVSAFVARNYERLDQFRQPYYVRTVSYEWSDDDGLEITVEAVNYASEAREQRFAS